MFKQKVQKIDTVVGEFLRLNGLETPLLQTRIINSWNDVVGNFVSKYTKEIFIKNQTLMIKITKPALRHDLSMRKGHIMNALNRCAGSSVIFDIKIF